LLAILCIGLFGLFLFSSTAAVAVAVAVAAGLTTGPMIFDLIYL
jgi:hypothetical protein